MMLIWWSISWTPYAMVFLASVSGHQHLISHHADMLPGIVPFTEMKWVIITNAVFVLPSCVQQANCGSQPFHLWPHVRRIKPTHIPVSL